MKRFLVLILLFLLSIPLSRAMIQENRDSQMIFMPSTEILFERFDEIMLSDFYIKSPIIQAIAGEKVHILMVLSVVNKALLNYKKNVDASTAAFMYSLKVNILEVMLEDYHDQFESLKKIITLLERRKLQRQRKTYAR